LNKLPGPVSQHEGNQDMDKTLPVGEILSLGCFIWNDEGMNMQVGL
jgi:hypothetical protein